MVAPQESQLSDETFLGLPGEACDCGLKFLVKLRTLFQALKYFFLTENLFNKNLKCFLSNPD